MKMRGVWICLAALALSGCGNRNEPPQGPALSGPARVIDGDTIVINGTHIRFYGIDAFEHDQTCGAFACGVQATSAMRDLTQGRVITCYAQDTDHYGRTVAICKRPDGLDLNAEMVRRGLAVAYRAYSLKYLPAEKQAEAARAGAWNYGFQSPLDFRRSHPHTSISSPASATRSGHRAARRGGRRHASAG